MNNLIFPPANAPSGDIAAMIFQAMQQHENYREGVLAACRTFYKLDLHTLQHLRGAFSFIAQQAAEVPQGVDYRAGQMRLYERIDEFLANAIELAGGESVKPEPEPEIPWGKMEPWANFVAMDNNGKWYQYDEMPIHSTMGNFWSNGENYVEFSKETNLIPFTAPDWRTSLRQRPAKWVVKKTI